MSRPVSWYRLFRGKVWHVGFAQDAAACGSERPADAETVGERAPVNARVCGDCVASALHLYSMAEAGRMGDPRTPKSEPASDGLVHISGGGPVSISGVYYTAATRDPDEWPCGQCGHPNLDHDCDDGTCTIQDTDDDLSEDRCPCRGLTRAG